MASTSSTHAQPKPKKILFVRDIQLMMFGLGDASNPLRSTAKLIEVIVLDQLNRILLQADEVAALRRSKVIAPEDILFLMRKNLPVLKRLILYLSIKDEKQTGIFKQVEEGKINETFSIKNKSGRVWKNSRKLYCLEFLRKCLDISKSEIDMTEDEIKANRDSRANERSLKLSVGEYKKFSKARTISFHSASQMGSSKFNDWLKSNKIHFHVSNAVAELLVYFAKETIAGLIDMALTLREEKSFNLIDNFQTSKEATPITPSEIQEVIRCCTFRHIQPFATFCMDLKPTATRKILTI